MHRVCHICLTWVLSTSSKQQKKCEEHLWISFIHYNLFVYLWNAHANGSRIHYFSNLAKQNPKECFFFRFEIGNTKEEKEKREKPQIRWTSLFPANKSFGYGLHDRAFFLAKTRKETIHDQYYYMAIVWIVPNVCLWLLEDLYEMRKMIHWALRAERWVQSTFNQ